MAQLLLTYMKNLGVLRSPADMCVMRLTEAVSVPIVTIGRKDRCDPLCEDLNGLIPINNLGELRSYAGCRFWRHSDASILTISHQASAEKTAARVGVAVGGNNPLLIR